MVIYFILITLGLAVFISLIVFAILLPINLNIVRITERFVCPPGMKMKVEKVKLSYHRPSEKGIIISCHGHGETKYVKARALFCLWLIFFLFALPIAAGLLVLIIDY